jgi:hypothetical protein
MQQQQQPSNQQSEHTLVEEKIVNKETGETSYRKYLKGRFLGKVITLLAELVVGWLCPGLRIHQPGD